MSLASVFYENGSLKYMIPTNVKGKTKGEFGGTPADEEAKILSRDQYGWGDRDFWGKVCGDGYVVSRKPEPVFSGPPSSVYFSIPSGGGTFLNIPGYQTFKTEMYQSGCVKFDKNTCPAAGSAAAKGAVAVNSGLWADRKIDCTYDRNEIISKCKNIQAWHDLKKKESGDDQWWDEELLTEFCGRADANDGTKPNMLTCSTCKSWARSPFGKYKADEIMMRWCGERPADDVACKCIKLANDTKFDVMQREGRASASCWYGPCSDLSLDKYLTPSYYVEAQKNCPNVCGIFWSFYANGQIDIGDVDISQECAKVRPPPTPKPTPADDGKALMWIKTHPVETGAGAIALAMGIGATLLLLTSK